MPLEFSTPSLHEVALTATAAARGDADERESVEIVLLIAVTPRMDGIELTWSEPQFATRTDWLDHPLKNVDEAHLDGDIVEDTPAVRAMIEELVTGTETKLSTACTHTARLIHALSLFWA